MMTRQCGSLLTALSVQAAPADEPKAPDATYSPTVLITGDSHRRNGPFVDGAPGRTRTADPLVRSVRCIATP